MTCSKTNELTNQLFLKKKWIILGQDKNFSVPPFKDSNSNISYSSNKTTYSQVNGECLTENITGQVTVKTKNWPNLTYIGATERPWKCKFYNHEISFKKWCYAHSTLSQYKSANCSQRQPKGFCFSIYNTEV